MQYLQDELEILIVKKKKEQQLSRRSFLSDAGKTIFFGTLVTTAIPTFLAGCSKESCNNLKEGSSGNHYCDDYYVCTDSRGFTCPSTGEFSCGSDIFSCTVEFSCTPSNNFSCQPSTAYTYPKGGAGS
jgi:hypothetical protein